MKALEYLSQLLNFDISDELVALRAQAKLNELQDLQDFILFVEDNFRDERFRFQTGLQKFFTAIHFYTDTRIAGANEAIERESYELSRRIIEVHRGINHHLRHSHATKAWARVKSRSYFSEEELALMDSLGDLDSLIYLSEYEPDSLFHRVKLDRIKKESQRYIRITPKKENRNLIPFQAFKRIGE